MNKFHPERHLDDVTGDLNELLSQIDEGEHQQQDFKFRIDSSQKIAKTLVAFANTDGGEILIGVKDNGKIAGIDPEEEYYMIEGASSMYCKPAVEFESIVYESEESKKVLKIKIQPSRDKPHLCQNDEGRWKVFIRQQDQNFEANRVIAKFLKAKKPSSKRKNFIAYGPEERILFDYLAENTSISLSKFSKISKLSIVEAENILVSFLQWNIIYYEANQNGIQFKLQ